MATVLFSRLIWMVCADATPAQMNPAIIAIEAVLNFADIDLSPLSPNAKG
jgi:hypothetical protein